MTIRSLTSFSLVTVLALGLVACGDDGKPVLTATTATTPGTTNNTTNTTNNNTTTDGTTTDDTATETETDGTDAGTATQSTATETVTSTPTTTEGPVTTTTTEGTTTDEATTSTTAATTEAETTEGTTTGGGGSEYGPCGPMGECPAGSDCLMLMGLDGNFCSPMCDGMTCPATGVDAMGVCALAMGMGDPTYCAALCPPGNDAACPEGTTCKEVPDQPNPVGICTAP
ncbi:hypothetical protein [Nannocystis punicea]|uniref:Uncharacterized protein n=1 Tax=Nannocystis punicea TaxID=2995304 RepID=A0ABY7H6G5_9BACT|nr:hypothetical protein [Nannocystis poenicansa]WAS94853.1 hypothetical protein O0S08_01720 [Nannocystis poenicansa]